jgi:hypothetical protein
VAATAESKLGIIESIDISRKIKNESTDESKSFGIRRRKFIFYPPL